MNTLRQAISVWYTCGIYLHPGKFCPIGKYCQSRSGSHTSIFYPQGLHYEKYRRALKKTRNQFPALIFQNGAESLQERIRLSSKAILYSSGSRAYTTSITMPTDTISTGAPTLGLCSVGYPGSGKAICYADK